MKAWFKESKVLIEIFMIIPIIVHKYTIKI